MSESVGLYQKQVQVQKQVQRMSQRQIQALSLLSMGSRELREEIYKNASQNPALEIVSDPLASSHEEIENFQHKYNREDSGFSDYGSRKYGDGDAYQAALENSEDRRETLQQHLMEQLNLSRVSEDEYSLCRALIYNLDKNGCYGNMLSPESLLDKKRPLQTKALLAQCLDRIQRMDPVGTCCKNLEESLFVQAKIAGNAPALALFILDGHLDLLNPPQPDKVIKNLKDFREKWHSKKFAHRLLIDDIKLTEALVEETIDFIQTLNPRPAAEYSSDVSELDSNRPDIILTVEKKEGRIFSDDFSRGKIVCDEKSYYQIKYASGILPELRLSADYYDKSAVDKAKEFLLNLQYRESSIVFQGCAIVHYQKDFFNEGPGHLNVLTRRQVAEMLGIHESTVSRMSSKNNSKYIQTEWGLFPASYFFSSGVSSSDGREKISSDSIKVKIQKLLEEANYSDSQLTTFLNDQGIKIARRTVAKYRQQIGIKNSYERS
ncbi:MAG: RNA polymerase factor sigma-54 [Treponema sp.]|nr:RNA polymerase factor sigma-54 [Treponema sp.]